MESVRMDEDPGLNPGALQGVVSSILTLSANDEGAAMKCAFCSNEAEQVAKKNGKYICRSCWNEWFAKSSSKPSMPVVRVRGA